MIYPEQEKYKKHSYTKNLKLFLEDLKKKNRIRDKFKKERLQSITSEQNRLYETLKLVSKEKQFRVVKEREVYTKQGVRFADLFIKKYGLVIEVDGDYHTWQEQKVRDVLREKEMWDKKRIITIRFSNSDILDNLSGVIKNIISFINKLETLPNWQSPGKGKKKLKTTLTRKKYYKKWLQTNRPASYKLYGLTKKEIEIVESFTNK